MCKELRGETVKKQEFVIRRITHIFWDTSTEVNRRFRGTCRLYLQGRRDQHEEGSKQTSGFLLDLFNSEDGGDMFLRNIA
jgi:hypothetical protein